MFVSLSPHTDKKGERMNSIMNSRRGGVLQKMIMRTAFYGKFQTYYAI